MSPEIDAAAAFAIAAIATYVATPVAISIAVRVHFFDRPAGYKGHQRPTPYLGGTAIIVGILTAVLALRSQATQHWVIILAAAITCAIGTLDDRVDLPISLRTLVEVGIAAVLWSTGLGWGVFHDGPADLALTVFWVVGVMNAFNLMDNMDGAAASVAAVSAIGAGSLALISGDAALAALSFAVAGACLGFLPRNLARPARIFMGDGGSLLLGLLVAATTMGAVTRSYFGPSGVVVAALLVALVIFDTTLVTISRTRAGRSVLSGGRDHLTHRLSLRLGSPRNVAFALAVSQLIVCGVTIAVAQAGVGWVLLAGSVGVVLGLGLIWQLESAAGFQPASPPVAAPTSLRASTPVVAQSAVTVPVGRLASEAVSAGD